MDRALETPARRCWPGIAPSLALAVGLVDLGCARLPWKKQAPEPPMLGRATDTTDIYAMNHRSGPTATPPGVATEPAMIAAEVFPSPRIAVDEVAMAVRPAEVGPNPSTGGVVLRPPTALDGRPGPRVVSPSDGVPNASLLLASAARHDEGPKVGVDEVISQARSALDAMANYEVSLHRQERVNGALLPEEDIVLAIRRSPRAVRLSWVDGPNQGREVLYRADEPGGAMHVKMANPALPRLTLPPESPLVMRNSRHPVTEAGLDSIVEGLENSLKARDVSGITYAGLQAADGIERPQHCIMQSSPAGDRWRIFLDPTSHLPSLVESKDARGELLESYRFGDVRRDLPELTLAGAFDPLARWGQPRGLFGRVSRVESGSPPEPR